MQAQHSHLGKVRESLPKENIRANPRALEGSVTVTVTAPSLIKPAQEKVWGGEKGRAEEILVPHSSGEEENRFWDSG